MSTNNNQAILERWDGVEGGPEGGPTPSVSVVFSVEPAVYRLNDDTVPDLHISYISHATRPITTWTFRTLMDENRTFFCGMLKIQDLTAQKRVWLENRHPQIRTSFLRAMGSDFESYYLTLMPEVPVTLKQPFHFLGSWKNRNPGDELSFIHPSPHFKGEEFLHYCHPGHRFRIGTEPTHRGGGPTGISWWRYGLKEEVLEPAGTSTPKALKGWSEPWIEFKDVQEADFTVE